MRCDVAVVGAGAAGIAAAVAAAKTGAKVILIERHGFTGGLATTALVGTICGLFYRNLTTARYAVHGFAREFAEAVRVQSRTHITVFAEGLHFLPFSPVVFHAEAVRQLQQAGVSLMLHSCVTDVHISAGQITELRVQAAAQIFSIYPAAVVDCSGNALVSMLAGIGRIQQSSYQAGAFVFQVSGLPVLAEAVLSLNLIRWLRRGIQAGALDPACERLSIVPGTLAHGRALFKLGLLPFDGSVSCHTQYELDARSRSVAIVDYLGRTEPMLANLGISAMAAEVGVRTSARSEGLARLDEQHVLTCAKPEDGVAMGVWPMEFWGEPRKPEMRYFALDDGYWITAGMLVSRHLDNLFFAGRGLSATEAAIASARVIGTCLSTGYAAGCLAAEWAASGAWQTAIRKIRQQQNLTGRV